MMVGRQPDLNLAARSEDRIASPPAAPGFDVFVADDPGDRLGGSAAPREIDAPRQIIGRSRAIEGQLPGRADLRFQGFLGRTLPPGLPHRCLQGPGYYFRFERAFP